MRFKRWIRHSQEDYKKYLKTRNPEYLAQAGEKLWNAYRHLISYLSGKKSFANYKELDKTANKILYILRKKGLDEERFRLGRLSSEAYTMHVLFYSFNLDSLSQHPYRKALEDIKYLEKNIKVIKEALKGDKL